MMKVEVTAVVTYTCYLSAEDEATVEAFIEEHPDYEYEEAVYELYTNNEISIYNESTESDFATQSVDQVLWE